LPLDLIPGARALYDLAGDPHETANRFDAPALHNVQSELTEMIRSRPDDALDPPLPPVGMA
jgi:hypothetical protein